MNSLVDDSKGGVISIGGDIPPPLPGAAGFAVAKVLAPKPTEIRRLLLELRRRLGWTQPDAAKALSVSASAITKWEAGTRRPSGPASTLILTLHKRFVENPSSLALEISLAPVSLASQEPTGPQSTAQTPSLAPLLRDFGGHTSPATAEPGASVQDEVAIRRHRAAMAQKYLADAMERVHRAILGLSDGEGRIRHLRELSVVLGMLSSKMSESLETSFKLGVRQEFEESAPVKSFAPGSIVQPGKLSNDGVGKSCT